MKLRGHRALDGLDQDIRDHIEHETQDNIDRGMTPEEARRQALLRFGNVALVREDTRAIWAGPQLDEIRRDIHYACRMLGKNPGFAAIAVLTLALGIGATTTVFTIVNSVLIRPLSYPEPDALVGVWHSAQFQGATANDIRLSSTMYLAYRDHNETFQDFGVWRIGAANVTGIDGPEEVRTWVVTHGTLPAIGVQPALGRWFSLADDTAGTPETVILSHGYWQRRFGGNPAVLQQTITIDSRPRDVIGVMPQRFQFMNANADVILPQRFEGSQLQPNDVHAYNGIARLKPGVSLAQADADVARMLPIWITAYGTNGPLLTAAHFAPTLRPLEQDVVGDVGQVLWVLMGTIGIVLLIACANVANLLLVRAEGRQHELTVRAALGAGWGRIARQLLVESMTLGVLGGAVGLGCAYAGVGLLAAMGPTSLPRLAEVSIDSVVLAFTLAVSLLSGLLFGLIPVVKYAGPKMSLALRDTLQGGGRALSQGRERQRSQNALVVAQVALAVVLLVSSGLMIRSFQALRHVQPGFTRPEQIQTVRLSIPAAQAAEPERVARMQHDIAAQIGAIPGVTSVSFATALPMEAEFADDIALTAEDKTYAEGIPPMRRTKWVAPGLFATLGTPLLAGRDFTWTDIDDHRPVAIVSENMAREMWDEPSAAIGKRIRMGRVGVWSEIIGVVGDVYDSGAQQGAPAIVYWRAGVQRRSEISTPYIPRAMTFAIRSNQAGTEDFVRRVSEAVWTVNPNLPLARVQTLGDVYDRSMSRTSFTLIMLAIAGSMALILGIIGVYGVISYTMSQRRREIGIRLALGAQPQELRRRFVRSGLAPTGLGIAVGLGGAIGLTRLMASLLFGISPLDPVTYCAVPLVMAIGAACASYVPVRRAVAMNPVEALKAS